MGGFGPQVAGEGGTYGGKEERGTIINKLFPQNNVMYPIPQKTTGEAGRDKGVPLDVTRQVDALIKAAVDSKNLSLMYVGWAPHL